MAGPNDEAGDQRSISTYLNEFLSAAPELYRFLLRRLRKREDADDYFQTAYEKFHRAVASGYPVQNAKALCFTIAANVANDFQRQAKVELQTKTDWRVIRAEAHLDPLHQALVALRQSEALAAQLTDEQARILVLDRGAGESNQKIAEMLGLTVNQVRWQKHLIARIMANLTKDE